VIRRADRKPKLCVVTDIDQTRLDRAASIYTVKEAASRGIELIYLNTSLFTNPVEELRRLTGETGYDDVFVFAPVAPVIEQGDSVLAFDGCLNFFAGPSDPQLKANMNFYNVHYGYTHLVGTSGGNTDDMKEALDVMTKGLDPAGLVTHIGGLNAVIETTLHLPHIPGGKKLIYTHLDMPLTAISDFQEKGKIDPLFSKLAEICNRHQGLWSVEAEEFLLAKK
jgi:threonine dehydrogenase-like Zn-dependent dehydrogenase